MSSTVLSGTPPTHAAHRGLPATFAALLRKDLRLATIIILPSLAALALLSLVAVITPLLGEAAMRALGLLALEGRGVLARIGAFATLFWIISAFACVLSALAIAAGDSSGRARHLLPVLPVSSRMAYASKTCACALVIAGFLCVTGAVQMSGDATMIQSGSIFGYGLLLANGVVWAFVAPLFARTFGGAFVVTIVTPMLLFLACSVVGDAIAFFALKWTLISRDAAPWFGDGSLAELIGPRTRASVLLHRLAAGPSREETRVDLIMLLTPCLSMLDPQWDNMSKWRRQPGEWLGGVDQHAWGLAPFRIDCGGGPKSCPMASARAEAVVFVTALEKRIEEGTFEPTDARSPHDRLSVGKAVLRAARHALEPSFPRLADHRLADSPWLKDATRAPSVTDDQSLYLPASLLFDHAQTDSSYLLPTGH